jgi:nitrate/nitrite transporter NarK
MVLAQGGLGYSIVSVYGAIPADVFRGGQYGLIFGCLSFFGSLGASSGPFLLGRVHDWTGRYDIGFLLAMGFSLLSIAMVWLARARRPAGAPVVG